jgi:uncharacterized oxidoreductase
MKINHEKLTRLTTSIFAAAGSNPDEAERIGRHLVEANLVGHDSHGVIRVSPYIEFVRAGKVVPNQSIGEQAVTLGIEKCKQHGVSVVALRNAGHLGRIGDWPLMAARTGIASLHFVNTSGAGILVAPFGGINRRLSANPIAAGVPRDGGEPILLDISCCTIAEGKLRVAFNKGVDVREGCIIDSNGQPTCDPKVFYAQPPGAILSIAEHKGYGLGIITELFAGALTGGGASNPANAGRLGNGMLSIYLDPKFFGQQPAFAAEVHRFVEWVKSSEKADPNGEILMPGEIEEHTRARRVRDGIELDDKTWKALTDTARSLEVPVETV